MMISIPAFHTRRIRLQYRLTFPVMVLALALLRYAPASAQEYDMSPGKKIVLKTVTFQKGLAVLEAAGLPALDKLGAYLKDRPELRLEISGHSDAQGNAAQNQRLSEERATAVKVYLVSKYAVKAENITAAGKGSAVPVADNSTDAGRAQNRRIEVIAQTSFTRQMITDKDNAAVNSDGFFSAVERNVRAKAVWDADFIAAKVRQPIYELHRVSTLDNSRAEVTFKDKSRLQIGENALVVIYGSPGENKGKDVKNNVVLERGGLLAKLRGTSPNNQLSVRTPGADIRLASRRSKVDVDQASRSTVSVHDGKTEIAAAGKTVGVADGFGTQIFKNATPEAPRPLPPTPVIRAPLTESVALEDGGVRFAWTSSPTSSASKTRLDVGRDAEFNSVAYSKLSTAAEAAETIVLLETGDYFWQLVAIDSIGLESKPTETKRLAVTPALPKKMTMRKPNLILTSPAERFTLISGDEITLTGTVDADCKLYLNGRNVSEAKSGTSYSLTVPVTEASETFTFTATNETGGSSSETVVVARQTSRKQSLGITISPSVPLGYSSLDAGVSGSLVYLRTFSPRLHLKLAVGAGGFKTKETIGLQSNRSGIVEFYTGDAGLTLDFPASRTLYPYLEANLGLFLLNSHRYTSDDFQSQSNTAVAPGIGLGVRVGEPERQFGIGAYYRVLLDNSAALGLNRSPQRGIFELRLSLLFQ